MCVCQGVEAMVDSTELLGRSDGAALWERLDTDGYLLLRGALDRDTVLEAGHRLTDLLTQQGSESTHAPPPTHHTGPEP
jgi:hypothetical protein